MTSDAGGQAAGPQAAHAAEGQTAPQPRSGAAGGGPSTNSVAGVTFALLVLACFAAFFLTQHLKHTPTAVQLFKLTPFFSPTPSGHIKDEHISFRLAQDEEATVTVVDSSGADVARLVTNHRIERYKQFSLRWNGRRGRAHGLSAETAAHGQRILTPKLTGPPAPAGEYRVRVSLPRQQRSVLSPRSFTLVRP